MKHPVLGEVTQEEGKEEGTTIVLYDERRIEISISGDEIPYEEALEVAASMVQLLPKLDSRAKQLAAAGLTENYNNGWNEYDEQQEDGTYKTVRHPKLTQEEFASKLSLRTVNVTGEMIDFFYDDQNMFWGHSVVVTSMDGVAFADTTVEIFG